MQSTWLWWSSGKDSAWCLHELRRAKEYEVTALVTTITSPYDRVAMHAVRRRLVERQAALASVELRTLEIPSPCSNDEYEAAVHPVLDAAIAAGVSHMAFGDLFLEDIRAYRESLLEGTALRTLFPLWKRDTAALARTMIDSGLEAYLTCVDPRVIPPELAGRRYDRALLAELPHEVDPCGENGEFHTFVAAGPMFSDRVAVDIGEVIEREGFVFADVLPA